MRLIALIVASASIVICQARIGEWDSFTAPLNINELTQYNDLLICATDGGILIYDTVSQYFKNLDNTDGLLGTKIECIELNGADELWIGGGESNGFIQIYNIETRKSLKEFNYELTEIIDFAVGDSIAYAVYRDNNDYGIIEFNILNGEFVHKDLYPNWPAGNKIYRIEIYNDIIFTATDIGLFVGTLGDDPHNWKRSITAANDPVIDLLVQNDKLYCYSNNLLYSINLDDLTFSTDNLINDQSVKHFYVLDNGNIVILGDRIIYLIKDGNIININIPKYSINSIGVLNNESLVFGTKTGLALLTDTYSLGYKIPNAPSTNNFQAVALLNDGRLVAASNSGLAIKESFGWRNIVESISDIIIQSENDYNYFIADSIPVDFGVSVSKIIQGPDNLLYCAIEGTYPKLNGGGVLIIDVDNPANFTIIDTTYLDYFADEYLIVKDIEFDRDENLWVADAFATTKHEPLHVRDSNGNWRSFSAEIAAGIIGLTPSTIAIDAWKRVWIGSFQDSDRNSGFADGGLAMLSYSGDIVESNDFQWHKIDISSSKSNNTVWSLAITPENRLYMLTPIGLTYFDLQYSNNDPIKYASPRYYFPNISFDQESEIRLDASGNAWAISASDGIHVLLANSTFWPDNYEDIIIESINTDNYPLLSNNVSDIAFDNKNGLAYISTNRGINSFRIPFAAAKKNYSELRIFPSPFHVPSDKPLIVDNLKNHSSLKVMTVNGTIIRNLKSNNLGIHGYQIQWDGKDSNGNWVGSGVYLLAVYTADGSSEFGKVVVIRD